MSEDDKMKAMLMGFGPGRETHDDLVGLPVRNLLLRAGDATHQHFKGGLYRLVGTMKDADTGQPILGKDGEPRILYEHVYPYPREYWVRDFTEFCSEVEPNVKRFRQLR